MSFGFKKLTFAVSLSLVTSLNCLADSLPEGSFKGNSNLIKNIVDNDIMTLLIKKDPKNEGRYYAILAEYDRIPLTNFTKKTAITKWVPRLYAFRIDKLNQLDYSMMPLNVNDAGDIDVKVNVSASLLRLKKSGSLNGAVLSRYNINTKSDKAEEIIKFKGKVSSTWEKYVPGTYLGTQKNNGADYFSKKTNMELTKDGVAHFYMDEINGYFDVLEKAPGLFTFAAKVGHNIGEENVVTKIGVFIDIVNWKPVATTDELLLINPNDASNVGFFYERH